MRMVCLGIAAALMACLQSVPGRGDESCSDLLLRVPDSANAVILLDLQAIKNSPVGKRENWASKHESEHLAGTAGLSPQVQKLVMAAELDPGDLQNKWEIGIGAKSDNVSMQKLAKALSGSMDKVGGQ